MLFFELNKRFCSFDESLIKLCTVITKITKSHGSVVIFYFCIYMLQLLLYDIALIQLLSMEFLTNTRTKMVYEKFIKRFKLSPTLIFNRNNGY